MLSFKFLDLDKDGYVTFQEWDNGMNKMIPAQLQTAEFHQHLQEFKGYLTEIDTNKDGKVSLEEWLEYHKVI